jgi:ethanolamine utilization microcompartment shell protein EutL
MHLFCYTHRSNCIALFNVTLKIALSGDEAGFYVVAENENFHLCWVIEPEPAAETSVVVFVLPEADAGYCPQYVLSGNSNSCQSMCTFFKLVLFNDTLSTA